MTAGSREIFFGSAGGRTRSCDGRPANGGAGVERPAAGCECSELKHHL